jgi:formate-nitrite transporter family protein
MTPDGFVLALRRSVAEEHVEQQKADEREALSAKAVHRALLQEGENELDRSTGALFWSAMAAGISIGLSLIAQAVLRQHLPESSWRPLLISLGYSFGFIAVTLGRQQLFTETTLTAMLPLLHHRRGDVAMNVLRLWAVVFAANMLGAFLFAWAGAWTATFSPELSATMADIGVEKVRYDFGTAFVKGIFGGWLIALMVWLMPSAHEARIWVIAMVTWLLAAAELTHIIAGSVDGLFAVLSGRVEWLTFLSRFVVPVFLGNSIGGIVFVAALNHAQVSHGEEHITGESRIVADPAHQ